MTFLAIAALMLLMTIYVFTFPKFTTEQITVAFFGIFYVGMMFSYLYQVRSMPDGKYLVWLIVLSSWGCDTCAYCAGMLLGKHKTGAEAEPQKDGGGSRGRRSGSGPPGLIYTAYTLKAIWWSWPGPVLSCAAACAIAAVISQIGDLAASAIKRNHGVKDYGHLIPGHGGILDRFDSMIFTAPAIYFAVTCSWSCTIKRKQEKAE